MGASDCTTHHFENKRRDALCTSLQTAGNEDESFDTYLAGFMITGEEKMVAWHTINFVMACEVSRPDELMYWPHEPSGRTFTNLYLIQLDFMDPDDPEDDPG